MADALLSPSIGIAFGAVAGGTIAYSAAKARKTLDDHKVPLMGVLGAFIFAAQMINFTIPGTGSSGHISGGLLLSILLGPYAAFLTIASVLTVQAFFFADGGLLALGCNIFNLGVFPCFIGLPILRAFSGKKPARARSLASTIGAAVLSLEAGALGVVMETLFSGRSELTLGPFAALMAGIHLPIGIMEGLLTAAVVGYVHTIRPELKIAAPGAPGTARVSSSLKPVLASLGVLALVTGGFFAWFASTRPDGLEWSLGKAAGTAQIAGREQGTGGALERLQKKTAFLPDYSRPKTPETAPETGETSWPAVDPATSIAGIVGASLVLLLAGLLGLVFTRRRRA